MISNVLRDLPFSHNQPPKSAEEWYIRKLKNNIKNIRITEMKLETPIMLDLVM
jgi:hypothetical protein